MSTINFGSTVSMTTAATPSQGWLLGYDVDGFLKQKDAEGVITQVGLGGSASIPPTPTLSEILEMSNVTGTYSIVMGTQTVISTVNGNSHLSLDFQGNANTAQLYSTDGQSESLFLTLPGQLRLVSSDASNLSRIYVENSLIFQTIYDTNNLYFENTATASYYSISLFKSGIISNQVKILESGTTYDTGTAYKAFLHLNTESSTTNNGVKNSVIIGGSYITAEEDETVYLPQVVIRSGDKIKGAGAASLNFEESGDAILSINNPYVTNSIIGIFSSTSSSVHLSNKNGVLVRDTSTFSYSPSAQSPVTFISTEFSYVDSGVYNTVIIGGNNLTATQSDTVYLGNKVNINNSYYLPDTDGSSAEALLTDGSGNLYWGTMPAAQVSTFSLYQILNQSNDTVNQNIMMGTATFLFSSNTGGRIYLDKSAVAGNVFISTNNTSISDTYIDMSQTDLSIYTPGIYNMAFDSSSIASSNLEGLVYGFDYSATFVTYSLVDKNYVDTLFTTSSPTFNNGLIEVTTGVIGLGGTLSQNTQIDGKEYSLFLGNSYDISLTSSNSTHLGISKDIKLSYIHSDYNLTYIQHVIDSATYSYIAAEDTQIYLETYDGVYQNWFRMVMIPETVSDGSENNSMIIRDSLTSKGLVYANDYTGQFTTHSLVSKGYADSLLSRVENGLTQSLSGNIGLGGQLNGSTIIDGNGQELRINGIDRISFTASAYIDNRVYTDVYYSQQYLDYTSNYLINSDVDGNTFSSVTVGLNSVTLESYEVGSGGVAILIRNGDEPIDDGSTNNRLIISDKVHYKGLVYYQDYSANFTTYSLVTKGYVDARPVSVNNGLTQSSGIIGLGGVLSDSVVVKGDQWSLAFDDMDRIRFTASTYIDMRVLEHTYTNWSLSSGSNYYNKIFDNSNNHHYTGFFMDGSIFESSLSTLYDSSTYSTISVNDEGAFLVVGNGLGTYAGIFTYNYSEQSYDGSIDNTFIISDGFNQKGLVYLDDYTGQFTTHSLVSKGYVDKVFDEARPYKLYTALLTQTASNAPTATVLENTFGIVATFSYMSLGTYNLYMSGQFTSKVAIFTGSTDQDFISMVSAARIDSNTIRLITYDIPSISKTNDLLNETSIEIRVYS